MTNLRRLLFGPTRAERRIETELETLRIVTALIVGVVNAAAQTKEPAELAKREEGSR